MAAKGAVLKQEIVEKILATFPNSFLYNDGKEIRINGVENGENIQIKVALTCAKVAVEGGSDTAVPGAADPQPSAVRPITSGESTPQEPSEDEKERLTALLTKLGL